MPHAAHQQILSFLPPVYTQFHFFFSTAVTVVEQAILLLPGLCNHPSVGLCLAHSQLSAQTLLSSHGNWNALCKVYSGVILLGVFLSTLFESQGLYQDNQSFSLSLSELCFAFTFPTKEHVCPALLDTFSVDRCVPRNRLDVFHTYDLCDNKGTNTRIS